MAGHWYWMLRSATWRFRLLKALLASTRIIASVSGRSNSSRRAWMAASLPAFWPAQTVEKNLLADDFHKSLANDATYNFAHADWADAGLLVKRNESAGYKRSQAWRVDVLSWKAASCCGDRGAEVLWLSMEWSAHAPPSSCINSRVSSAALGAKCCLPNDVPCDLVE